MSKRLTLAAMLLMAAVAQGAAAEIVVAVGGANAPGSEIGCALFSSSDGFPLDFGGAKLLRVAVSGGENTCRWSGVAPGAYAVAATLFRKGQTRVEKDFLGRPKAPWAVSNNIRHALRAPDFDEAAFRAGEGVTRIRVNLAR